MPSSDQPTQSRLDKLLARKKAMTPKPFDLPEASEDEAPQQGQLMRNKVDGLVQHMSQQHGQHQAAITNCNALFNELLDDLPAVVETFRTAFGNKGMNTDQIYCEVDADRSVGILRILWHTLSFTTRGNAQPLALAREGQDPMFTGRILCIRGDFQDVSLLWDPQHFGELLSLEIASLFVPPQADEAAIMMIPHLGNSEEYFHQQDAARLFLLRTVELVCGGGFLHEHQG